jgi:hypothetical protein
VTTNRAVLPEQHSMLTAGHLHGTPLRKASAVNHQTHNWLDRDRQRTMNKKIIMLALAAATAAVFAMPSAASATLQSLHTTPTPAKLDIAGVGQVKLRTITFGGTSTITCNTVTGTATPEAGGTTGTLTLRFGGSCTSATGTCTSSSPIDSSGFITTTPLPYHLVTIDVTKTPTTVAPGILVTPGSGGAVAHWICGGFVSTTLGGNGLLGTITSPACGGTSSTKTISFKAAGETTTQQHRFTEGLTEATTTGAWSLTKELNPASLEAHATLTATNSVGAKVESKLDCT